MLEYKDPMKWEIKIADFGFASFFDPTKGLKLPLGSCLYMAPEICKKQQYDEKVDIWATGIITYQMLSGHENFPFFGDTKEETKDCIKNERLKFDPFLFEKISEEAKEFISLCLCKEQENRLTAKELLQHRWQE